MNNIDSVLHIVQLITATHRAILVVPAEIIHPHYILTLIQRVTIKLFFEYKVKRFSKIMTTHMAAKLYKSEKRRSKQRHYRL